MTSINQLTRNVLGHHPDGLTFRQLLNELRDARPALKPNNLSPILSLMSRDGTIYKHRGIWALSPLRRDQSEA
jgi:hypothetical protein